VYVLADVPMRGSALHIRHTAGSAGIAHQFVRVVHAVCMSKVGCISMQDNKAL